jgi:hypothetical protein
MCTEEMACEEHKWQCPVCPARTVTERDLAVHIIALHLYGRFLCLGCWKTMLRDKWRDQWRSDSHNCFKLKPNGCTMIYRVETPLRVRELFREAVTRINGQVTVNVERLIPPHGQKLHPPLPCQLFLSRVRDGRQEASAPQAVGGGTRGSSVQEEG